MQPPTPNQGGELALYCAKCTREQRFAAPTLELAAQLARRMGWVMEGEKFTCPRCPAVRIKEAA